MSATTVMANEETVVGLLHGFELSHRGRTVGLPHSAERLVALLAIQQRPVRREWVAGTLWLNSSQEHANGSLRTTLWRLDRPLRGLVQTTATQLSLRPGVAVDSRAMAASAYRVLQRGAGSDELASLTVGGDLLPDWYDDWVVMERERLRHLRLRALETLCVKLARSGRGSDAAEAGLAAVAGEPLRESAQRALIIAYLAEGNSCDALRQYQIFRDMLRRDLDLAPSPALQRMIAAITG